MADIHFAISNQSDVEQLQLKENSKNQKYFESNTDLVESFVELDDITESQPRN